MSGHDIKAEIAAALKATERPTAAFQEAYPEAPNGWQSLGQMPVVLCHLQLIANKLYDQLMEIIAAAEATGPTTELEAQFSARKQDYDWVTTELTSRLKLAFPELDVQRQSIGLYGDWMMVTRPKRPRFAIAIFGPEGDAKALAAMLAKFSN